MNKRKWLFVLVTSVLIAMLWWLNKQQLNVLGSSFVSGNYAALAIVCLIYLIFISVPMILKRKMPDLF